MSSHRLWLLGLAFAAYSCAAPTLVLGHARGNHAGRWSPGQEVRVCVCEPPAGVDTTAVTDALDVWNNSKDFAAGVRGLRMTWTQSILDCNNPPADCDVVLGWSPGNAWGAVQPPGGGLNDPVRVDAEGEDVNARGLQRILMHEFGHVKGLGHSALSVIMRWNFRGSGGNSPTAGDLNGADAFEAPNDDDSALNRILHSPAVPKAAGANAQGNAERLSGGGWRYYYLIEGRDDQPSFMQPITRFTLELPSTMSGFSDLLVTQMPPGWNFQYFPPEPALTSGQDLDNEEQLQKAVLTFFAINPANGIFPGGAGFFEFRSPWAPTIQRAYSNSPTADSDEFLLKGPAGPPLEDVPATSTWGFVLLALAMTTAATLVMRRLEVSGNISLN